MDFNSVPSSLKLPFSAGRRPTSARSVEVLPTPLRPIRQKTDFSGTSMLMPRKMRLPPMDAWMPRNSRVFMRSNGLGFFTQVHFDDAGIVLDVIHGALAQHGALMQHCDTTPLGN